MLLLCARPLEVGRDHERGVHPAVRVQHAVVDPAAVLEDNDYIHINLYLVTVISTVIEIT